MTANRRYALAIALGGGLILGMILFATFHTQGYAVPEGYVAKLRVTRDGRTFHFGPFKGYYFQATKEGDPSRVRFVCRNEEQFYTKDLPEKALLFRGEGVLTVLDETGYAIPDANRINPVYFTEAPSAWVENRPEPQNEFLHFHSGYTDDGAVQLGYWLRHVGEASFTYDMGGRVGAKSALYHEVRPGVDTGFARIIEFDQGR